MICATWDQKYAIYYKTYMRYLASYKPVIRYCARRVTLESHKTTISMK